MTGRGIDQIFPHHCPPHLYEPYVSSALDYVALAEEANGPIERPVDYGYIWGDAAQRLERERPDVRIVNLETSITTSEDAAPKTIHYRMHPANVAVLTAARIDCCALANNHVLDWGRKGLLDTLDNLQCAGIRVAGAGQNETAAGAPAILEVGDGRRVLVFALGARDSGIPSSWAARSAKPGIQLLPDYSAETLQRVASRVRAVKRPGDVAVASIHWGPNWGFEIDGDHRRFAHGLIDRAQIDVVHGHSSHHAKAIELHNGRLVLYGCGDFVTDYEGISGYEEFRGDLAVMYLASVDTECGALRHLSLIPFQLRNFRLREPSVEDRQWLWEVLDRECRRFGHGLKITDDSMELEL